MDNYIEKRIMEISENYYNLLRFELRLIQLLRHNPSEKKPSSKAERNRYQLNNNRRPKDLEE